jgi:hypothetical protein
VTGPLTALVADALSCVAAEHPEAHALMCAQLGTRTLSIALGREQFAIAAGQVVAAADGAALTIRTDAATLDEMLRGELAIVDALCSDRLDVRGTVEDLLPAFAAMTTFLQGAIRCIAMPPLLDRLSSQREEQGYGQ